MRASFCCVCKSVHKRRLICCQMIYCQSFGFNFQSQVAARQKLFSPFISRSYHFPWLALSLASQCLLLLLVGLITNCNRSVHYSDFDSSSLPHLILSLGLRPVGTSFGHLGHVVNLLTTLIPESPTNYLGLAPTAKVVLPPWLIISMWIRIKIHPHKQDS